MKPVNFIKMVKAAALTALFSVALAGCTKEDLSVCGMLIQFTYTKNIDNTDKFPTDIDKISLYVFDSEGIFVGEYHDEGAHLDASYRMKLKLPTGRYSFVAWGNCADCYDRTSLTPGVTRLDEALLSYKCATDIADEYPEHLYHGGLYNVSVVAAKDGRQRLTIDMMKNTNTIRVIRKGIPEGSSVSCTIESTNADYKFNNDIHGTRRLTYRGNDSMADGNTVSDFRVLRECNDNCTDSKLIIIHHAPGGKEEIFNVSLVPLLIRASKTGELDIDDYFELTVELDYTHTGVTLKINNWVVANSGGMVG